MIFRHQTRRLIKAINRNFDDKDYISDISCEEASPYIAREGEEMQVKNSEGSNGIPDYNLAEIDNYCYLVGTGKPCASMCIQNWYLQGAIKRIKKIYGLKIYSERLAPGWRTVWIYKDEFMLKIIKMLPKEPKTAYDHWVIGKAFGYSDEAIREFVETNFCYK